MPVAAGSRSGSKTALGVLAGFAVALMVAVTCFTAMRMFWPGYADAEPTKSYDLGMLLARLTIGLISVVAAAVSATKVAEDRGRAGIWVGWLAFTGSLPLHLYFVWDDYPAWYHFLYLAYIVPTAHITVARMSPRAE